MGLDLDNELDKLSTTIHLSILGDDCAPGDINTLAKSPLEFNFEKKVIVKQLVLLHPLLRFH